MKNTYPADRKKAEVPNWHTKPTSLKGMALAHEKTFWFPGEKILIWSSIDPAKRAYLVERGGVVDLILAPYPDLPCKIFQQDPLTSFWDIAENLEEEYEKWKQRIKVKIKLNGKKLDKTNYINLSTEKTNNRPINRKYHSRRRDNHGVQIGYKAA